jgi:hypothetical protein
MTAATRVRGAGAFTASALVLLAGWLAPIRASAQDDASSPKAGEVMSIATYKVRHDHAIGSGAGELVMRADGFEFRGEGDEAEHSRTWRDEDIKRIEIRAGEIEIFAYEAARLPVLPKQLPWVDKTKAIHAGTERQYEFHLVEGEVAPDVVRALLVRFKRPLATTVVPNAPEDSGALLFEIPVFHRHVSGGESGVLRIYESHVVFDAEMADHSRHWRYSDIRDVGRLGRWKFEIATWEDKTWTDGKSYVFDLKRPMTEAEYETVWRKLYSPDAGTRPSRRP